MPYVGRNVIFVRNDFLIEDGEGEREREKDKKVHIRNKTDNGQ